MSNVIKIAKSVIDKEIAGLEAIKSNFDNKFENLVKIIQESKGKVILSGMGKSGHIANKIVATLASTGTPSFFIHPAEASHGDLGMITKDDIVILLSNSGETKELSDIICYCKRFNIVLVALVRRNTSILVEESDIAIILPESPEASTVNAPTTSTTMMLAFGDALAVVLAEEKGFSKMDFNVFHPGGKLGSQFIKTEKIMRKNPYIPLVKEGDNMKDVILTISQKSLGCAGVIDNQEKLVGIITDGDLRRHLEEVGFLNKKAVEVMTKNPITIKKESLAISAVNIMQEKQITDIFVTESDEVIGILHIHDCFKAGII